MNTRARHVLLGIAALIVPIPTLASAVFTVAEPWVRIAPDARSAEAYMQLASSEGAMLVGVRSELPARVTLRPPGATRATVDRIGLPPGTVVTLAPGGYRIGLAGLDRPLKLGERFPLVLTIEAADGRRQEIPVSAEVRRRSPTDDHRRAHAH